MWLHYPPPPHSPPFFSTGSFCSILSSQHKHPTPRCESENWLCIVVCCCVWLWHHTLKLEEPRTCVSREWEWELRTSIADCFSKLALIEHGAVPYLVFSRCNLTPLEITTACTSVGQTSMGYHTPQQSSKSSSKFLHHS